MGWGRGALAVGTSGRSPETQGLRRGNVLQDADITTTDIPKLLGIKYRRLTAGAQRCSSLPTAEGIKVVSMALVMESQDTAVIWRGPMKMAAIKQFLEGVTGAIWNSFWWTCPRERAMSP